MAARPSTRAVSGAETPARNPKGRRHELLGIASQVFAEKGIANTTVRDIAEMAGILSGSLYHHFESKDQIVAEVLADGLREAGERDAAIVAEAPDPRVALHRLIVKFVAWVGQETQVARILANDKKYLRDTADLAEVELERQANRRLWTEVVETGVESGVFRSDLDPEIVVRAILDGALASVRWLPPVGTADPVDVGEELARFYVAGLLASN